MGHHNLGLKQSPELLPARGGGAHHAGPGALPGEEGRLTGELLLELPDQSCCLLLLLRLLKPLALELRQKPEVQDGP